MCYHQQKGKFWHFRKSQRRIVFSVEALPFNIIKKNYLKNSNNIGKVYGRLNRPLRYFNTKSRAGEGGATVSFLRKKTPQRFHVAHESSSVTLLRRTTVACPSAPSVLWVEQSRLPIMPCEHVSYKAYNVSKKILRGATESEMLEFRRRD